jgi:hypothetical protein
MAFPVLCGHEFGATANEITFQELIFDMFRLQVFVFGCRRGERLLTSGPNTFEWIDS